MARVFKVWGSMGLDLTDFNVKLKGSVQHAASTMSRITRSWQKGLSSMSRSWSGLGKSLAMMTAPGLAGLYGLKKMTDQGGQIRDWADKLGMGTAALTELQYAMKLVGIDGEGAVGMLSKMQKTLGGGSGKDALRTLGLDPELIGKLSTDEAFTEIVDALGGVENQNQRTALSMELFGKSGAEVNKVAKMGKAGLQSYREEAKRFGASISEDMADRLDDLGDNLEKAKSRIGAMGLRITDLLIPALDRWVKRGNNVLSWFNDFSKRHSEFTKVLGGFGIAATLFGSGASLVILYAGAMAGSISSLIGFVRKLGGAMAGLNLANPWFLAAAGIAAAALAINNYMGRQKEFLKSYRETMSELLKAQAEAKGQTQSEIDQRNAKWRMEHPEESQYYDTAAQMRSMEFQGRQSLGHKMQLDWFKAQKKVEIDRGQRQNPYDVIPQAGLAEAIKENTDVQKRQLEELRKIHEAANREAARGLGSQKMGVGQY